MSIIVREKPLRSNLSLGIVVVQEVMRLHPVSIPPPRPNIDNKSKWLNYNTPELRSMVKEARPTAPIQEIQRVIGAKWKAEDDNPAVITAQKRKFSRRDKENPYHAFVEERKPQFLAEYAAKHPGKKINKNLIMGLLQAEYHKLYPNSGRMS